jgi:hypothetical protein
MSDPRDWQTLFAAAMLEGDSTQLPLRIERAEETIQARLRELPETFLSARNKLNCSRLFGTFAFGKQCV